MQTTLPSSGSKWLHDSITVAAATTGSRCRLDIIYQVGKLVSARWKANWLSHGAEYGAGRAKRLSVDSVATAIKTGERYICWKCC